MCPGAVAGTPGTVVTSTLPGVCAYADSDNKFLIDESYVAPAVPGEVRLGCQSVSDWSDGQRLSIRDTHKLLPESAGSEPIGRAGSLTLVRSNVKRRLPCREDTVGRNFGVERVAVSPKAVKDLDPDGLIDYKTQTEMAKCNAMAKALELRCQVDGGSDISGIMFWYPGTTDCVLVHLPSVDGLEEEQPCFSYDFPRGEVSSSGVSREVARKMSSSESYYHCGPGVPFDLRIDNQFTILDNQVVPQVAFNCIPVLVYKTFCCVHQRQHLDTSSLVLNTLLEHECHIPLQGFLQCTACYVFTELICYIRHSVKHLHGHAQLTLVGKGCGITYSTLL